MTDKFKINGIEYSVRKQQCPNVQFCDQRNCTNFGEYDPSDLCDLFGDSVPLCQAVEEFNRMRPDEYFN